MLNVDGLISGLDTSSLIEQLLELERRPIGIIANQVQVARQRQTAFLDISARLLNLQTTSARLSRSDTFRSVTASTSDAAVLAVSAESGVPPGLYSFRVAQLARASQHISRGFATSDETPVGAGTLSLELGGGAIDIETELDVINGGTGVTRGSVRLTDASGATAVVDLSAAITVNDVLNAINNASGINVVAAIAGSTASNPGRGIVIEDTSGGMGTLVVEEVDGLDTAADLGILGNAVGSTLEGSVIQRLTSETRISTLADGLGARTGSSDDILITDKAGGSHQIDLDSGVETVGDLIQAFQTATGGNVTLAINSDGDGFDVSDTTGGGGSLVIANGTLSAAASDLGIEESGTAGTTVSGTRVLAGINDVLLDSLNGGTAFVGASIDIRDRASSTPTTVNLTGAETLQDVLRAINASAAQVTAEVNPEGNGIELRDTSGGGGDLIVTESGGTAAAQLGILGTVSDVRLNGSDLNPRYVHQNTRLDTLNGGRGVAEGSIRITDSNGIIFTVNLAQETTMGDVVTDIEGAAGLAGSDLVVSYNSTGNGLLLTSGTGSGPLVVAEVGGGTTARDLHLVGSADSGTLDGAFEETLTISATDTLADVLEGLESLGIAVTGTLVNDGSTFAPFRLNIVADVSGRQARLLVDTTGSTALSFSRTSRARDGVVFYGETGAASESVLIRSGTNTYRNIVNGLTITALRASATAQQVTVQTDSESIKDTVAEFVEKLNGLLAEIDGLTDFNEETETRGILLGDSTVRNLKRSVLRSLSAPIAGLENTLSLLSEVGIRLQNDIITFDSTEFDEAYAEDPNAVRALFTAARPLDTSVLLEDFNNGNGVDRTSGAEIRVHLRDGTTVDVDLDGATRVRDVIDAINAAGTSLGLTATLSGTKNSLVLTDTTSGSETLRVTALNSSSAANDLGLNKTADQSGGGTLTGFEIDLTDDSGIMARITDVIEALVDPDDGVLQRRSDGFDLRIADLEERIANLEERIVRREDLLRRQFAQLEQILATSQATLSRLTAQLGTLNG